MSRRCPSAASMAIFGASLALTACSFVDFAASLEAGHAFDDRLIVTMKTRNEKKTSSASPSTSSVFALSTVLGVQSATVLSHLSPVVLLTLGKNADANRVIKQVASMDGVLYVERDVWITKLNANEKRPNDQKYWNLYGMEKIEMPKAWAKYGTGSENIVVCVIDTGIDYNHPDLQANMWVNTAEIAGNGIDDDGNGYVDDVYGINAMDGAANEGDPMDDDNHGTHCAGTIGGVGDNSIGVAGVNWQVELMGCKFMDENGGTASGAIRCIDYAISMGAHLTSNSWGLGGVHSSSLKDAIRRANDTPSKPQLFIAAAGNSGTNNDNIPAYPASYNMDHIIAVAATDSNDKLTSWSQYGATTVDLGAPGSSVLSTVMNSNYGYFSGTSMACPHVAGAVAYMMSVDSSLEPLTIKQLLMDYGDSLASLEGKTVSGKRLNVFNALENKPPSTPAPETPPSTPAPETPPSTPAPGTPPSTPAPETPPSTPAPVGTPPSTPAPETPPYTPAPETPPSTPAPIGTPPSTPVPETPPYTPAPETPPSTPAPIGTPPSTHAPETPPPTPAPETSPSTPAPETSPSTPAPETPPTTPAPVGTPPSTPAPNTPPSTPAPKTPLPTPAPETPPSTHAPETPAPFTPAPVGTPPSTPAPDATPNTPAPSTSATTPAPTTPIPDAPTVDCFDEPGYYQGNKPKKTCAWIAKNTNKRCKNRKNKVGCPQTCGLCPGAPTSPTPAPVCKDDPDYYQKKPHKTCAWIAKKASKRCRNKKNKVGCPETCGFCDDARIHCEDNADYLFNERPGKGCAWVSEKPNVRCSRQINRDACPDTCNVC